MHDGFKKGNLKEYLNNIANSKNIFLALSLFAVIIIMTMLNPRFLSVANIINISKQMSINMIIAVGMTFAIISGGVDLSVGAVGVSSGCITGIILASTGNVPLAILAGLLVGGLFGLFNGIIIAKFNVLPFIGTLGTMTVARGLALLVTGGYIIRGFPQSFNYLGVGFIWGIPVPVVIMLFIVILGHILLTRTEFGLNTYAIGGNYKAARLAGLKNELVTIKIYILIGVLSALAGILLTARVLSAQPSLMSSTNLDVIAAVVVGGTSLGGGVGSIKNTLLGTILMASLFNGLNLVGVGYEWQLVVIGFIVIIAVSLDMISRKTGA